MNKNTLKNIAEIVGREHFTTRLEDLHCYSYDGTRKTFLPCSVSDRGAGIAPKHLPFIFDRFYRADASRNRQTGGTGLGLAIVRALITAQGGRVAAESEPGAGATIIFWLPTGP